MTSEKPVKYLTITIHAGGPAMSAAALEAIQQYAYRLAHAVGVDPATIRADGMNERITFSFADDVTYDAGPIVR
jgi:hypothetical protein